MIYDAILLTFLVVVVVVCPPRPPASGLLEGTEGAARHPLQLRGLLRVGVSTIGFVRTIIGSLSRPARKLCKSLRQFALLWKMRMERVKL